MSTQLRSSICIIEQNPELLETDGVDDSEATQVIYYIEDGVVAR